MIINLYDGNWVVNIDDIEYLIVGNKEVGYDIYYNLMIVASTDNVLFSSNDFEECLVWCYNS